MKFAVNPMETESSHSATANHCHPDEECSQPTDLSSQISSLAKAAFEVMKKLNRESHFLSLLKCVSEHILDENIALHLLLDVAHFLCFVLFNDTFSQ